MTAPETTPAATWADWEAELVAAVLALEDGATVTAAAPVKHARMAATGGRLRWLAGSRRRPLLPTARLVRVEDHLRGHWTGSRRLGGRFPWTAAEEEALLGLGWHRPTVGDGEDFVRFWPDDVPGSPYLDPADATRAAAAVAATFGQVLGVEPDEGLPTLRGT
ncbi:hypothetical protein H9L10_03035 [Phycicoccus endophyticus]|uniref:TY-Chap N-terminal domain-containing protein n=1 Tax=Phycicoccus endophyticus TaxID=1690220 RepID=A0A7G9R388_9MICO|nr:hypothetical protein [Phycicoccus endophyticus]NHI19806.1 hypothetical protein [Phycicoccus endophyticus]QNN50063.1 hypothetical protein H9L10_03035 [Phycicoccus endophyticus]GGL28447.1 hypothetical protein GCM10012283_08310 [Phycicoccus endophyticus]